MGTYATVSVPAGEARELDRVATAAGGHFREMESSLSIFKPGSEISRLNDAAGIAAVTVSAPVEDVLRLSVHYSEITGGAFDPTVAPLVRFWGFNKGQLPAAVPDEAEVRAILAKVGYRNLVVSNGTAALATVGMGFDPGGIAKGYAVDVCFRAIGEETVRNLMINLGGNIRCRGEAEPGRPWCVGVRDPFSRDSVMGTIRLDDGMAVATSGNYEKQVVIGGKRYAHIIDPLTGWPVEGVASVTVIATNAVEADAMSTAVFVLGARAALPIISRMPGCHFMLVPDVRPAGIYLSPGAGEHFTLAPSATVIRDP
ncbi:MAG: FAD:protein FMN transferase [bacterium]